MSTSQQVSIMHGGSKTVSRSAIRRFILTESKRGFPNPAGRQWHPFQSRDAFLNACVQSGYDAKRAKVESGTGNHHMLPPDPFQTASL